MKQPNHWLRPAVGAALGAILISVFPTEGRAADHLLLSQHLPAEVASGRLRAIGSLPDTNRLRLAISLPLRNQTQLDQLLKQLYDPNSPNYHQYLSVAQFTESFGPTKADYQALRDFARANGLRESSTYSNRLSLGVDASVADIRRVFHVNILSYNHPRESRQFYAPDKEPALGLSIPVLHISGLDNYMLPHPLIHKKLAGGGTTHAPMNGSQPFGYYWGSDFRNAYAPGVSLLGTGQNAALFEYDGYYSSDIVAYEQETGLPDVTLTNVAVDGGIAGAPGTGVDEVSLDIEMIIAMAPGISKIFVYESPGSPAIDVLNQMASDNSSKQISSSWVFDGGTNNDAVFKEFAAQGQSFYQASGDGDAYVGQIAPPEDNPYITQVGGTELVMNGPGSSFRSESVWNIGSNGVGGAPTYNGYWGSGGGVSATYLIPIWQQGINMSNNLGSTTNRNTPDVALTADNIWVNANQGADNGGFMGTSCAAPLWCGFTALINEQAAIYNYPPVGFINPAVYKIGKGATYTRCFHDTTVGSNTWLPGSPTNFPAVPGYDLCTGWGSPTGSNLINALAPPLSIPVLFVVTNTISNNTFGVVGVDQCSGVTLYITNEGFATATGIHGFLYSTTFGAIVGQSTANFPDLPPNTSAASTTQFTLNTQPSFVCGTPIDLMLVLTCDQAVRTNAVALSSGIVVPPVVFGNSTNYVIPANSPAGILSPVTVSGLQSAAKITVSVYAQTAYDRGLELQLISPNGATNLLTALNGGLGANYGAGCTPGSQTTFDDSALNPVIYGMAPFVGSFQPMQPLSSLLPASGTNLNGVWLLNAVNLVSGDPETLQCWSLNVTPYDCLDGGSQCPGSGLYLAVSPNPNPVVVGNNEVFTLSVSNAGPSPASNIVISQTLPPGFVNVTVSNSSIYPVQSGYVAPVVTLTLATLPVYGSANISVTAIPTFQEKTTTSANVTSSSLNPNPNNATTSASLVVTLPEADLAASMTASPSSVLEGGLVTFTIVVTNNGPYAAMDAVLTNALPPNVNYVSSTTSQGFVSVNANVITTDLGFLPVGYNTVVTITVSPTSTGNITDTAQAGLSSDQFDPVSGNNSASATVMVSPSSDLAVSASVTPLAVVAGSDCAYVATVVNNGPAGASDVVFTQTIPGGTGLNSAAFVSSSQANATVTNGIITWNIGTLASGGNAVITNVLQTPIVHPGGRPISLSSTFSVSGLPGDANTNNNVVTVTNVAETPMVAIVPVGAVLVSQSNGPPNGALNPGETVGIQFYLQNTGSIPTTSLEATLQTNGGLLPLPSVSQNYGSLAPGGQPVGQTFNFTVTNSTNGGTVVATLSLKDGSLNLGTVSFSFALPLVQTFSNTNPIYIPALSFVPYPDEGPASPYPSTIQVSNISGYVSKVTVTVSNLYHTYPNDIGMLLVGPQTNVVLMDAAALYGNGIAGATLIFDSTAATVLPEEVLPGGSNLVSGSYSPANYNPNDVFANAASRPYGASLGVFNGLPANGAWMLYAHDDAVGDAGGIANGWSVTITTITPVGSTNILFAAYLQASAVANSLQLTLLGVPGKNYAIQTSSNLLNWTSVVTNTASLTSGVINYTDTRTNAPVRFYRSVQLPQ